MTLVRATENKEQFGGFHSSDKPHLLYFGAMTGHEEQLGSHPLKGPTRLRHGLPERVTGLWTLFD